MIANLQEQLIVLLYYTVSWNHGLFCVDAEALRWNYMPSFPDFAALSDVQAFVSMATTAFSVLTSVADYSSINIPMIFVLHVSPLFLLWLSTRCVPFLFTILWRPVYVPEHTTILKTALMENDEHAGFTGVLKHW